MTPQHMQMRLDKWLWAARFFKTRAMAKKAIEGGKVHCDGERVKVSKQIRVGMRLTLPQGWDSIEVEVMALSEQRRGAPEAQLLYQETPESREQREKGAEQRSLARQALQPPKHRPDKKDRRAIHRFQRQSTDA
ncbi:RNA-binding S4 domain-containing protein [Zymobacter palmae]|uniref:Heat shock protein 15 n=1 Tax=Zymobacter palmae TaxID=33074 RepID=A0A348HCF1_9GAMM|nr:S4 domain-containing protein [Zymobacter palmae]BBG29303.1 ribosome-associated heat shock protein [Zymobacter palmae]